MLRAEYLLQVFRPQFFKHSKIYLIMGKFWQGVGGAAVISGVGSLGSGLFGGLFSKGAQKRQYKYNLRLQKQQQEWQRTMWDLENQYNLPKNEISRLLDAGINPAMAFSNGGASAAPVPQSGTAGGVSAPTASMPNVGASVVDAMQAQQRIENETKVADAAAERDESQAALNYANAGLSGSQKKLVDNEYKIRSDPSYVEAMQQNPAIQNGIARLDRELRELNVLYENETYGKRIESLNLSVEGQRLTNITSEANFFNVVRTYDYLGAQIAYLESGSLKQRGEAKVLAQDLDIRAGKAFLGTLQRDAYEYCVKHGVKDSVTKEIVDFTVALADQYSSDVVAGKYTSASSAVTANQESIYQSAHGQEQREYATEESRRRGNLYRTMMWNMCINTFLSFAKLAIDNAGPASKAGVGKSVSSTLVTPKAGVERMSLSPEARKVWDVVYPGVEKRLQY